MQQVPRITELINRTEDLEKEVLTLTNTAITNDKYWLFNGNYITQTEAYIMCQRNEMLIASETFRLIGFSQDMIILSTLLNFPIKDLRTRRICEL